MSYPMPISANSLDTGDRLSEAVRAQNAPRKGELNEDAFYKLLAAEYAHQNPLEPKKDSDSVAQMMQLTAMQGMKESSARTEASFRNQEDMASMHYVGREVLIHEKGRTIEGTVTEWARIGQDREVRVMVDGHYYDPKNILQVRMTENEEQVN